MDDKWEDVLEPEKFEVRGIVAQAELEVFTACCEREETPWMHLWIEGRWSEFDIDRVEVKPAADGFATSLKGTYEGRRLTVEVSLTHEALRAYWDD